jgi:hypothetical protein
MCKVVGSVWYGYIGIVQVVQAHQLEYYRQTGDAQYKYYIGVVDGKNEKEDAERIAAFGMPFDVVAGNALFGVSPTRFIG